jgi:hypothetical protein
MMGYLARLKQLESNKIFNISPDSEPTKPTKGGFDGFVGSGTGQNEKKIIESTKTEQQRTRRQKVTKMLADSPHLNHVMLVDDSDQDPDYHIVALAVRDEYGGATSELLIPRAKVDIWQLMEFIQQYGQVKH